MLGFFALVLMYVSLSSAAGGDGGCVLWDTTIISASNFLFMFLWGPFLVVMWSPLYCVVAFSAFLVASALPVLVLLAAACVACPWALHCPALLVGACDACGVCLFARVPPSAPSAHVASFSSSPRVRFALSLPWCFGGAVSCWCCVRGVGLVRR